MSETLNKLYDQHRNLIEQSRALLDAVEKDGRSTATDMTGEEEQTYQRYTEDLDKIDKRSKELLESEKRAADAEASMRSVLDRAPVESDRGEKPDGLRALMKSTAIGEDFGLDVRGGLGSKSTETRTLTKGTNSAGGFTVPTSFYNQLVEHLIEVSGVLQLDPTIVNTGGGESLQIPKTTSFPTGALVSEGGTIPASDPAFGQVTLGAYKIGALVQISHELLNDSAFNIESFVARVAGRGLGNTAGAYFVTGTGSSQPQGVVTGASVGVTGSTGVGGGFSTSGDNLIDLYYSVIEPYRNSPSCGWLMRDATVAAVRKIKDTTNQYIWQPGLQAGSPATLLGKPIHTDPNVPAIGLGAKSVIFGDFSSYFIRQVEGLRFERSIDFAFNTDLVTYRALIRVDGALIDTSGALKAFAGGAS